MSLEQQYLSTLELTHQMLLAARAQDWDTLTRTEKQRLLVVEEAAHSEMPLSVIEKDRVAKILFEIERESDEIMERVQSWQAHVKILLRMTD